MMKYTIIMMKMKGADKNSWNGLPLKSLSPAAGGMAHVKSVNFCIVLLLDNWKRADPT